ncbi:MAG: hypothetical protein ACI3YK_05585 [Eubacteriales bacterium]
MADEFLYPFCVAGVSITLKTPLALTVTDSFRPFLSDSPGNKTDGYVIEYRENPDLTPPDGHPIYRSESYEVYPDGHGGYAKWYYDGMRNDLLFVRVTQDLAAKRVIAEYLPSEQELVSAVGNCFSFGGWERLMLQENRLILHASCIDTPFGGILFSGRSGIGKSTQAALWERCRGARLLNGDRPILHKTDCGWLAYGSPYAGSSRCHVNDSCPVRAVVLLGQADECTIRPVKGMEAFRRTLAGMTVGSWDGEAVVKVCDLAQSLVTDVPVYELTCTPDERAVKLLESVLMKGEPHGNQTASG